MIPDGLAAEIELGTWPVLPIFDVLEKAGNIDHKEMYNIFNMGIGMVLAIDPPRKDEGAGAARRQQRSPPTCSAPSPPTPPARKSY